MRRRALLPAVLLSAVLLSSGLLLPGLAAAQVPGSGATPLPPLPPLPNVPLTRGIALLEPGAWRVEFPAGSDVLDASQRIVLGRIGAVLNTGTVGRTTLIAEVGEGIDLSTTRRRSLARARAVKAALAAGGLAETRIDIRPMGHTASHRETVDVLAPTVTKP
jgi:hypothetical protein